MTHRTVRCTLHRSLALVASLVVGTTATHASADHLNTSAYALADNGATLVVFDLTNPAGATTIALSGANSSLDDIDFRPLTGQLFGYDDAADQYVTIDTATGVTTDATLAPVVATDTGLLGIDFNPQIDRMRTVTETDTNIVYNPNTGGTVQVTDLFYGPGMNEGIDPAIVANGYTNSRLGSLAASTTQFAVDADLDILTTLANNAGTLTGVGQLGFDITDDAGFDVFLDGNGDNAAYGLFNVAGVSGLYSVNLDTGAASLEGVFDAQLGTLTGLAIAPVPAPGALSIVPIALFALTASRRRRVRATQSA